MLKEIIVDKRKISQGMDAIKAVLIDANVANRDLLRNLLAIEDLVVMMLEKSETDSITIKIRTLFDSVTLKMKSKGERFNLEELRDNYGIEEDDVELRAVVDRYMSRILGDDISISNRDGINNCTIRISKSRYATLIKTLGGLILGLLVGEILKAIAPVAIATGISETLFASISNMFMNALKLIVGPLVFFSMAASVADFSDLAALGKIAIKIVCGYLMTSLIAVGIGFGVYNIFPIGDSSLAAMVSDSAAETIARGENLTISIKDLIVNIIPSDYVSPLLNSDMLQIIFLGAILGIAIAGLAGQYPSAKKAVICLNDIFSRITSIIIGFMPVAVFCSMAKMVIEIDFGSIAKIAAWIPVNYIGFVLMIMMYILLLFLFTRLNSFKFIKKFFPVMITAFSLSSSNATMPYTIKCCEEKLGISKKLYSFSIPLGATINMDGSCITLMVSCLFMAKIFGVTVTSSMLLSLIISIMAFSIGAPGVPGSALVGLSIMLPQIGVPAEGVSIIMGIYSIVCMGQTVVNVTGDAVVTTVVSKLEKLIDVKKYNAD